MGSVEEIMMGSRWAALAALLALAEATKWSNIGFMSSQDQAPANKRSAEDGHELSLDDMELSASETKYDAVPYTDLGLSSGEAESRVEPFRRRKYRRRRRKNRYENLVVPGQDYSEDTLSDNKLYDRDSSYKAPSANYAAPESSYEAPSYSSYEENGKYELKTNSPIQTLCLKQKVHIFSLIRLRSMSPITLRAMRDILAAEKTALTTSSMHSPPFCRLDCSWLPFLQI